MSLFVIDIRKHEKDSNKDMFVLYDTKKEEFWEMNRYNFKTRLLISPDRINTFVENVCLWSNEGKDSYLLSPNTVYEIRGKTGSFDKFDTIKAKGKVAYTVINRFQKPNMQYYTVVTSDCRVCELEENELAELIKQDLVINAKLTIRKNKPYISGIHFPIPNKTSFEMKSSQINSRIYNIFMSDLQGYTQKVPWGTLTEKAFENCKAYFQKKYSGKKVDKNPACWYNGMWNDPIRAKSLEVPMWEEFEAKFVEECENIYKSWHNIKEISFEDRVVDKMKECIFKFQHSVPYRCDVKILAKMLGIRISNNSADSTSDLPPFGLF